MPVHQMAKFLEREIVQLYIEFYSYVEVDRLARKEDDQLKAAEILNDWLSSDINSTRITEQEIAEGRTNGAFTRWKPITKWYRKEITKFEYLLNWILTKIINWVWLKKSKV